MPDSAIRVLLVEDNDGDAFLVEDELRDADEAGRVKIDRVATLAGALERVDRADLDVVLLDLGLPDAGAGIDALQRVLGRTPSAAVVVLTGLDDAAAAAAAVAAGAQDYVVKRPDLDGRELLRTLQFAAERGQRLAALSASNDELGAFAHTVAHDLRGPLASITGMATLLAAEEDPDPDLRRELAGRILAAGTRLSRLVAGLLSFAEQAGELRDDVDLGDVVEWAGALVADDLDDAGGTLTVAADLPTVPSNEPALRTVMLNLLSNAIKYAHPDRPPRVTVDADVEPQRVVVTVGDNGVGIASQHRLRVFALGERAATPSAVDGVGIGLSSVHRIVQQLGGTIWIADGEDDQGVRVRFALPRDADVAGEAPGPVD